MELADGTLMDRLIACREQGQPGVPRDDLLRWFAQAAEGLDFLNEPCHVLAPGGKPSAIQHGDVKPQNLLLVGSLCKVGDFGLLRVLNDTVAHTSASRTPAYAPPEVSEGNPSPRSDQYALAVSWCQCRGDRLPFAGGPSQLVLAHLRQPPDLSMLPEGERPVVARALSKKPEARWSSCRAFLQALQATTPGPMPSLRDARSQSNQATARLPGSRRRISTTLGLLAGATVLTALVLTWSLWPTPRSTPAPPRSDPLREGKPFTNSVGMEMIPIQPGTFRMGSEPDGPEKDVRSRGEVPHDVTLKHPFHLAACPVTVGQFRQFVEDKTYHGGKEYQTEAEWDGQGGYGFDQATGKLEGRKPMYSWKNTGWKQDDDGPVVNVSWNDAQAYCQWLSKKEDREYRLPSEAMWEYCCRAGTRTAYFTGDEIASLKGYANLADASLKKKSPDAGWAVAWDDNYPFTSPVGKFKPNPWGLYDMHGNVWQWCSDRYGEYDLTDTTDPEGATTGDRRVLRGGSWCLNPQRNGRAADRNSLWPSLRGSYVGFRVACCPPRAP
jgi:formylglycine-generating enzyme required for sulfatase activity